MEVSAENIQHPVNVQLRKDVAAQLSEVGGKVRTLVIEQLVTEEITLRKTNVLKVLTKIEEKTRELKKSQNQGEIKFALTGEAVGAPSFTKAQLEDFKKQRETIERLQTALHKALNENDFSKLNEAAQ